MARDDYDDPPRRRRYGDDADRYEDRPRSRYRDEDDYDDRPPRPRRDEDDFDDRPRRRKKKSNLGLILGLSLGGGGLVLIIIIVLIVVLAGSGDSGPDVFGADGVYRVNATLNNFDPVDPLGGGNCRFKAYPLKLTAGKTYTIDLVSNQFDAYLRLEDPGGRNLVEDDDSGGNLNARIVYTPPNTGTYRIIATSLGGGTGNFNLTVRRR